MPKPPQEIRPLARTHTEIAVKVLADVMNEPNATPSARVAAALALLDRGWGKPTQDHTVTVDDKRDASDWTRAELVAFLDDARAGGKGTAPADGRDG
jgi:hypothetical protein